MTRQKYIHALLIFTVLTAVPLFGEVRFSGELKPEVTMNIPGDDGYESSLNPDNTLGVEDVIFRNEIDLKLSDAGDTGALDFWMQLNQYPMADTLTGTAYILSGGDVPATQGVAMLAEASGSYLYTADILRASAAWTPRPDLRVTLGRQSYLTGYGYGWNPSDLANPPKNPTDPQAYLRGVDGITFQGDPLSWMSIKTYGLLPSEGSSWEYSELMAGGEMTLQASLLEIKFSGLYGGEEKKSDLYDAYPHAGAAAVYADVMGAGLYAEGVVRSRSRRNTPGSDGMPSVLGKKTVYSALAGGEYYFSSGLAAAVEYFFNGEGWDQENREDFALSPDMTLYTPLYFARHYLLVNLMIPWYVRDTTFNVNLIYSPDSAALIMTPSVVINLNYEGTLVTELLYSGMTSLDDSRKNEAWLSPVKNSMTFNLRYFF